LPASGVSLKQDEKFKYLGVAFTNDRRQDQELDIYKLYKVSAEMRALHFRLSFQFSKQLLSHFSPICHESCTFNLKNMNVSAKFRKEILWRMK